VRLETAPDRLGGARRTLCAFEIFGLKRLAVRTHSAVVFQSKILLVARPALHGVLPAEVIEKVFARDHALGKIPQSLRAGAIFSAWIGVFSPDRSSEFTLQLVPTLLGHSRHPGLPFPHGYRGYGLWVSVLLHIAHLFKLQINRHFDARLAAHRNSTP
jgi:hypothetical protein